MRSKLLYVLVLLTGICFVMSALEINTAYIKNTFNDEYDHYIQPDNNCVQTAVIHTNKAHCPADLFTASFFPKIYLLQSCDKAIPVYRERTCSSLRIYLLYGLIRI